MGTNSKTKLTSNPNIETLLDFLATTEGFADARIIDYKKSEEYKTQDDKNGVTSHMMEASGYIGFSFLDKESKEWKGVTLFFLEDYCDKTPDSSYIPFTPEKYLFLDGSTADFVVDALRKITEQFGGYLIPDSGADEDSDEFYEIINGKNNFIISEGLQSVLDSLTGMNKEEKINFLNKIRDNK